MIPRALSVVPLLWLVPFLAGAQNTETLRLDTVGYLPGAAKVATIGGTAGEFAILRAGDDREVLRSKAIGPRTNADTAEVLFLADFSALREPGEYRMTVPGVATSAVFRVSAEVYREPFRAVTRAMYLWRCGMAVRGEHEGESFAHAACHTNDGWLDYVGGTNTQRDGTGGWHDAGDYNKYVVNAGISVGAMLRAWEDFGPAIRRVPLGLPDAGGPVPEFLAEVKWELDWLLKMQAPDGSVYHKLSTRDFGGFILPEAEQAKRFFVPWSSAATADFVAMLAQGARCLRPYDAATADRYLTAARKSQAFLEANLENHRADQTGFTTGGYPTRDDDDRLWAAAELWETTGDPAVLKDLETRLRAAGAKVEADFDWGNVGNLGVFTYLASARPGRDEALVTSLRASLLAAADSLVRNAQQHGYARPRGTRYNWGGNGAVARQTMILEAAHRIDPKPEYRATALDAVHHLLGRNVHGRSYVTGLGHLPPLHPHDRRSGGNPDTTPWPGYLVGGPNPAPADWHDEQKDFRTNEIAINWNAALIYALAGLLEDPAQPK